MTTLDDIDRWSDDSSSDESWTPSIGDGDDEVSDDEGVDWRETPFHPGDIHITFDKTRKDAPFCCVSQWDRPDHISSIHKAALGRQPLGICEHVRRTNLFKAIPRGY
jgi:hypothetical protein